MNKFSKLKATEMCEMLLKEMKSDYLDKKILISEIKIIDKLLVTEIELEEAYFNLAKTSNMQKDIIHNFFDCLLYASAFRNDKVAKNARSERQKLIKINDEISSLVSKLSDLINEKDRIHNIGHFADDSFLTIIQLIDRAAEQNGYYNSFVKTELLALDNSFDLKYWPSFSDVLNEFAHTINTAEILPHDNHTEIATRSSRPSKADYFDVLLTHIEETRIDAYSKLPKSFKLKDDTIASFGNIALELSSNNIVDGQYIKTRRSRLNQLKA